MDGAATEAPTLGTTLLQRLSDAPAPLALKEATKGLAKAGKKAPPAPDFAALLAAEIQAGRVFVNGLYDAPEAPFGGFKQSGLGREFGVFGLDTYLEPKAIMGHDKRL